MNSPRYVNVFSLGCSCDVAMGLARMGLRSFSGPFDWMVSSLPGIVLGMQESFLYLFDEKHLEIQSCQNNSILINTRYQFQMPHEAISVGFKNRLPEIRSRYARRLDRFFQCKNSPTLYVRSIQSQTEADYLAANYEEIQALFCGNCASSRLVFVCNCTLHADYDLFRIASSSTIGSVRGIPFEENEKLLLLFDKCLTPDEKNKNLKRYINFISDREERRTMEFVTMSKLCDYLMNGGNFCCCQSQGITIYGLGTIAKQLIALCKKRSIPIVSIIDKVQEGSYEGIPIIPLHTFDTSPKSDYVVVTPVDTFRHIYSVLQAAGFTNIAALDTLFY